MKRKFNLNKTTHLFLNNLNKTNNLTNKKIVCGFSGGADSTALLDCLIDKRDFFNYELEAVFFTHGNSPIAVDEDIMFKFCTEFCKQHNVKLHVIPLNLEKIPRQGWESSGRTKRLEFYKNSDYDYVFLGHHKDDQNETTMTQLMRGGGKGASAMLPRQGFYCRPFLNIRKKEIYEYLENKGIQWIEDPTNTNTDFTRNFWRNVGLPTIEQHYPNYSQMLDNFRQKNQELNELAFEMAIVDGLENFILGNEVNVKSLSNTRLKNLLTHYFKANNKGVEDKYFDQLMAHYQSNNKLIVNHKGVEFYISKGILKQGSLTHNLKQKP